MSDRRPLTRRSATAVVAVLASLSVLAAACGGSSGGPGSDPGKGGSSGGGKGSSAVFAVPDTPGVSISNLQYTPEAVVIDRDTVMSSLKEVSRDGTDYTFSLKDGKIGELQPGSVMLLQGTAVRKVTSVDPAGDGVIVHTDDAALTDLLSDGEIRWDGPLDMSTGFVAEGDVTDPNATATDAADATPSAIEVNPGAAVYQPAAYRVAQLPAKPAKPGAQEPGKGGKVEGKLGNYGFSIDFQPKGSAVSIETELSQDSPLKLKISAKGTVDKVTTKGEIVVNGRTVQNATIDTTKMTGEFELSYSIVAVAGLGAGGQQVFRIPAEMRIPLAAEGIPLCIILKSAFFVAVGFSKEDQGISGKYTVKYDGAGGISVSDQTTSPLKQDIKAQGLIDLSQKNAQMNGPIGIVIGAEIPRLEVGLGLLKPAIGGYVDMIATTAIQVGGQGGALGALGGNTGGCDARALKLVSKAGFFASAFGFTFSPNPVTLYEEEMDDSYPPGCGKVGGR